MVSDSPVNRQIAQNLRQASELLEQQGASPYRVNVYKKAAKRIARLPRAIETIVEEGGFERLVAVQDIGAGIARAIMEMLRTGRWSMLDRLRGQLEPEALFQTIPGIGEETAQRIHDTLHVDSLEQLERMAHDGRLEQVSGIGPRRAEVIRLALATMLARVHVRHRHVPPASEPDVATILDVDREYCERIESLPKIASRRFDAHDRDEPTLPILHTDRDGWHFTAFFSNTPRAVRLHKEHDWVVVFFYDGNHEELQRTVVTETQGPLRGERVVRGRNRDCMTYYGRPSEQLSLAL